MTVPDNSGEVGLPEAVAEHPDTVFQLQMEFLRAGANVMQTFTFSASEENMESKWEDVNATAYDLSREVAGKGDALVMGGSARHRYINTTRMKQELKHLLTTARGFCQKKKKVDFLIAERTMKFPLVF
ncbi:S-methylmethionine--homocysteine S-methyltransferase BHMT2-like [Molossus molossus]|uniref:S-methylmethionine--homocysteine S-methyltransferase BHMT2-like n=1 Tax=Molossus molossus TaxID=27622 RepID=UPI0017472FCA|nr:S-methylmethionine--homocysteine S-methyltransferase BHMT2-like [Molossus molossus]